MVFYQHNNGTMQRGTTTLEQLFDWKVRFQVLVANQEEYDLLSAYQLMFGREIQIDIFSEWVTDNGPKQVTIGDNQFMRAGNSMLPITFTTFERDMWHYA